MLTNTFGNSHGAVQYIIINQTITKPFYLQGFY